MLVRLRRKVARRKGTIRDGLLSWATVYGRDFPWRGHVGDSYAILIAELLLKRTTASAAAKVYSDFLRAFPNVAALGHAREEELANVLTKVGLQHQRARAIKALAHHLLEDDDGEIPNTQDRLSRIPGLGPYSAAAVLSFGFNVRAAIVDANVRRVINRLFGGPDGVGMAEKDVLGIADRLVPPDEHRRFNFAILDFAALVCRYGKPDCGKCPIKGSCNFARASSSQRSTQPRQTHRLRLVRKSQDLSLVALARKAKVSKLTIINIEAGRTAPRPETVGKLANALGVPVNALTEPIE